jgi:hypothetical protein
LRRRPARLPANIARRQVRGFATALRRVLRLATALGRVLRLATALGRVLRLSAALRLTATLRLTAALRLTATLRLTTALRLPPGLGPLRPLVLLAHNTLPLISCLFQQSRPVVCEFLENDLKSCRHLP